MYDTVRPSFFDSRTPAFAIIAKCRDTTERSTEQHSATSVTPHGRAHFDKHASNFSRVGSASARNNSASSRRSISPGRAAAAFGLAGLLVPRERPWVVER
jgi:hypothetical protein